MWPDDKEVSHLTPGNEPAAPGRTSSSSDVIVFDERCQPPAALNPIPTVSQLNAYKSKVHLGTKIELHDGDIVKGRLFGLDLVHVKNSRRLRCSVAIFVCWTLVVATGLIIYLVKIALSKETRLDIDLPCPQYVWNSLKSTSRAERLTCTAALLALAVCVGLVIYFTLAAKAEDTVDVAPEEWNITRKMWLAQPYNNSDIEYEGPLKLVIIQHSVSPQCHRFAKCAAELRNLQHYFLTHENLKYDIPYNFLIGNDGRVYEGRGWNKEGAHTRSYNRCSVGIGFIGLLASHLICSFSPLQFIPFVTKPRGDYREEISPHATVTQAQLNRCLQLLSDGVRMGYLEPNYVVVGGKDLRPSDSPGSSLYNAVRKWSHYDHKNRYKNQNCTFIQQDVITALKY